MAPAPFINPQFKKGPARSRNMRRPFLKGEAPFPEVKAALLKYQIPTANKTLYDILRILHSRLKEHYATCQCRTQKGAEKNDEHSKQVCTELLALINHTKKLIRWLYKDQPAAMPYKLKLELYRTPIGNKHQ